MQTDAAPIDIARMTRLQNLAALLIILGPESAAQLLKGFDEIELESITREMSGLTAISPELQAQILGEFGDVAVEAGSSVSGGVLFAKKALEKTVGTSRASDILSRMAPAPASTAMQQITSLDPRELSQLLKQEQPQTIALVASYLPPANCSRLLMSLRDDLRDQVVERLATLEPTPVEVVERIVAVLSQKAVSKPTRALSHTGGLKNAADVLNSIGKRAGRSVLTELEKRNPELGQAIREKMFTFEDLARLDTRALQLILREVGARDLAIALKSASKAVKQAFLSAVSRRAADSIEEEINLPGPPASDDIEAARLHIICTARQLEALGEINLGTVTILSRDELLV